MSLQLSVSHSKSKMTFVLQNNRRILYCSRDAWMRGCFRGGEDEPYLETTLKTMSEGASSKRKFEVSNEESNN